MPAAVPCFAACRAAAAGCSPSATRAQGRRAHMPPAPPAAIRHLNRRGHVHAGRVPAAASLRWIKETAMSACYDGNAGCSSDVFPRNHRREKVMGRVTGKVALVTGSALGIGKATAELLASEGAKVVVSDLKVEAGQAVAKGIVDRGGQAIFVQQDATEEAQWEQVVAAAFEAFGQLNIVVNNAGIALSKNVEDTTLADWRKVQAINLDAVFLGTRYGIEALKRSGGGSIVNLSSIEGLIGDPDLAAYNASKGGVRIFTKSAALHCAKAGYGIRVNSVHPGYIWTPMVQDLADNEQSQAYKHLVSLHPIGHLGDPADIAYGILYLASDESKFVTGSELVIDGGYTAQ